MRELWVTIAHTSGAKIYAMVVGVFTLFLTARLLGPEGRGHVAAITTWVVLFGNLAYLSLGQVALHRMAGDKDHARFGALFSSLVMITAILTLVGWLVAFAFSFNNLDGIFKDLPTIPLIIGFLALPVVIWELYGSFLLMGLEKIKIYNRYQIIGRTIAVLTLFLLVGALGAGVAGVIAANLLGQIVVALGGIGVLLTFARKHGLKFSPSKNEIKALLAGGCKLHLNAVGTVLFTSTNVLILNHFNGAEQTGYFQLSVQLLGVMVIIPQAAGMVLYGKVSTMGPNGAWPMNRKILLQVTLGMMALGALAAALAPWGITFLAGEAFRPAVAPFQLMQLGLIGMTFSAVMAPQWIARGYFWQAASLSLGVGVLNVLANFILIPRYGMTGAAYAYIMTYGLAIIGNGAMAAWCQIQYMRAQDQ